MVSAKYGNSVADATAEINKPEKHRNHKGMSWPTAAVFIVGDMMGGGMIALPIALVQAGLIPGIVIIILGAIFTGYTGVQLGDNWTLMQFGIATVLTLLASNNLSNLLAAWLGVHVHFCYVILVVGVILWPFVMLKSPMDFCLFLAYGTIAFAYGGHGAFPTIQHDMTKPFRFNRSVWASYVFIVIVYLIVSITGYEVYGNSMRNTVIPSLQISWLSQLVNVMITVHVLPTVVIVFSPLAQQVEDWSGVPSRHFGLQRFAIRSLILFGIIFTAESIPHFGVGGSTITLMTMLLPSVFYLFLFASHKKRQDLINTMQISPDSPDNQLAGFVDIWRYTSKPMLMFNIASLVFGFIGGLAASSSAVMELLSARMVPPCYVQWFTTGLESTHVAGVSTQCCGPFSNITVNGVDPTGFCL
ncbi:unnamed protein product [Nippostrongylus brasiliensis]|uniref:Aa_trans domain-containing protein n=1 Tax=Nippostrongylus brasiliensis TaxID=27835 RepID=A0A158QYA5_NIPBR|nr:unnamed protein product [Nippostrongylus brasiliensis]